MSAWRKLDLLWQWSPVATLPIALLFAGWVNATWHQYRTFAIEYDSSPTEVHLLDVGVDEWNNLVRRTQLEATGRTLTDVPKQYALNTVQLFADNSAIAALDSDLPYSGYEFQKGHLMFQDGLHAVKLRYRGDFIVHWAYDKKSIRVKTGTNELYQGMRAFNLIVPKFPEQVNNYLGYRLARLMGIMSPRCELVNVSLNGRNQGLYEFTEQLEEGTLRSWDRMPGDLYSGDLISKTAVNGTTNRVFEQPQSWDKIAANNHFDLDSRAPLERLLRLLNSGPSEQTEGELSKLLDMSAFGALGAYELLTQTHHFDEYHNWRLFWDPWALKFHPVVWDPIAWAPDMRPAEGGSPQMDLVVSRLHVWLHRNGDFLVARHAALQRFFEGGLKEQFDETVDWTLTAARAATALDPNVRPTDPEIVAAGMVKFRRFYDQVLRDVRIAHLDTPGTVRFTQPDTDGTMAFEVSGRQPVDEVVLTFRAPVTRTPGASLRVHRGGATTTFDLGGAVMAQGSSLRVPARMLAQLEPRFTYLPNQILRQRALDCVPTYYELQFTDLARDHELMAVHAVRAGRTVRCELAETLTPSDLHWLYRSCVAHPERVPTVWSGDMVVDGVREVFDDVIIAPGTTIRMRADASIVFRARVHAVGTAEQPIRIVPAAEGQAPWGTFAINSPDCSGSSFRFLRVRGGSGYKTPVEEYTAMFSIHNCHDVRVEDSRFADNFVVDDMIHVIYSEVLFDRDELIHARADALDCDISRIVVRNSRFVDSDNDGVDLMTTMAVVHDCQFLRNGDKGISIGESTKLIGVRNTFDGCQKAMEAKDGSIARVANCEIRNCQRALNAYRKNWRYDAGGDLEVLKSRFTDNREMPTADPHSRVVLLDCQIDKPLSPRYRDNNRDVANHATQDHCSRGPSPAHRRPLPFPRDLADLEATAGVIWATTRTDYRGGARAD